MHNPYGTHQYGGVMISKTDFENLARTLYSMSALHGMEIGQIRKLALLATEVSFAENEVIYREGDEGTAIYFIEKGQVAIEVNQPDGDKVTVSTVGPGQLFGWSALFPGRRKQASARALAPTWAIALNAAQLHEVFRLDPTLETALIQRVTEVIADRLASSRRQLAQIK